MKRVAIIALTLLAASAFARDPSQVRKFRKTHPCPATRLTTGACPGWVVDHVVPLCGGGPDWPQNMRWQTRADSKIKDKRELSYCACLRRGGACTWKG